ncbi:MBL fold metallo-hydrolase [Adhaeretor mobilis]|uniref:Putative metallo-hydrolase n=1 Tax=Adhaeretor mobilis TaxID=1930276 RepID=A0A517MU76_9BACT|nr:MBL fold metallo-hydrolase [Adhaeretor mobilis]QDS98436.1 putative metallo-hydrolase [Adhaeretor mobilis]
MSNQQNPAGVASTASVELKFLTVTSQLFEENCYVVYREGSSACVVVDPGLEPDRIIAAIEEAKLVPEAILLTHGHADHIAGNAVMKEHWPELPLIIGEGDAPKLLDPVANLSEGFGVGFTSPPADRTVVESETLEFDGVVWTVLETPGHSSGHVVFVAKGASPMLLLGGDVLFAGSVGRTDFPDSNPAALFSSIREKLYPLPDESLVLPGHGPPTTIGREKRTNPFVGVAE